VTAIALAAAQQALAAGIAEADRFGVAVSVAVVDAGGVLRAFARMDGAEIAGEVLAVDKAYTAVAHRTSTADLGALAQPGGELFGLEGNGRGRYVMFGGGVPVTDGDGVVIGAVGVSGAAVAQDVACRGGTRGPDAQRLITTARPDAQRLITAARPGARRTA
jgi:uncharacterized protein GlcG (DUF336 family)